MRTFKSLMISLCMGTTLCMCLPQTTTAQTVSSGDSWTWVMINKSRYHLLISGFISILRQLTEVN